MPKPIAQRPLPTELHTKRQPPTPEQVRATQFALAEKDAAAPATSANLPAVAPAALPSVPALNSIDDYFGRNPMRMLNPVRPNLKVGEWLLVGDTTETPLPAEAEYVVFFDHTWAGMVRLEEAQQPQYEGGLLFAPDFHRPSREALGDRDPAQWPISQFDGQPRDPWLEAAYVPIERLSSGEIYTIQIQAKPRSAAIFAVDGLLSHCRQMARRDPNSYPIIRLGISSYESRKYGTQFKPAFPIVGKTPKTGVANRDTSISADLNDDLPEGL